MKNSISALIDAIHDRKESVATIATNFIADCTRDAAIYSDDLLGRVNHKRALRQRILLLSESDIDAIKESRVISDIWWKLEALKGGNVIAIQQLATELLKAIAQHDRVSKVKIIKAA